MKIQKLSHLMNRYLPSLGLALLIAIPIYTPAHAATQRKPVPSHATQHGAYPGLGTGQQKGGKHEEGHNTVQGNDTHCNEGVDCEQYH